MSDIPIPMEGDFWIGVFEVVVESFLLCGGRAF